MKDKLQPMGDRIIVSKAIPEEKTGGGIIYLPDNAKTAPQEGEVLAVGPGRMDDKGCCTPVNLQVGDKILFAKYSGTEVKIDGTEYLILGERDVLAKYLQKEAIDE